MIDFSTISDQELAREYWRRINAKRTHTAGRKRVLRPCEYCGEPFGAREMLSHVPQCKKTILQTLVGPARKARTA